MMPDYGDRVLFDIEEMEAKDKRIVELEGALWNSTRNMQDVIKYQGKFNLADFKAAIERNRRVLNAREGE